MFQEGSAGADDRAIELAGCSIILGSSSASKFSSEWISIDMPARSLAPVRRQCIVIGRGLISLVELPAGALASAAGLASAGVGWRPGPVGLLRDRPDTAAGTRLRPVPAVALRGWSRQFGSDRFIGLFDALRVAEFGLAQQLLGEVNSGRKVLLLIHQKPALAEVYWFARVGRCSSRDWGRRRSSFAAAAELASKTSKRCDDRSYRPLSA